MGDAGGSSGGGGSNSAATVAFDTNADSSRVVVTPTLAPPLALPSLGASLSLSDCVPVSSRLRLGEGAVAGTAVAVVGVGALPAALRS